MAWRDEAIAGTTGGRRVTHGRQADRMHARSRPTARMGTRAGRIVVKRSAKPSKMRAKKAEASRKMIDDSP